MTPKIIHHIIGRSQTDLIKKCLHSWSVLKDDGFEILLWTDDKLEEFIALNFPFALRSFQTARNYAEASDIARYLLVYKFGGYYVDWDILLFNYESFQKISNSNLTGYLLIDTKNQTLASEHFSAPPGEEYLLSLVKDIVATFNRGERELMGTPQFSGPYRMKVSYAQFPKSKQCVIDVKKIFEYDYTEIRQATTFGQNKIMVHYWTHTWF
jgi:mannosyltransferase OCH1-like enzyme